MEGVIQKMRENAASFPEIKPISPTDFRARMEEIGRERGVPLARVLELTDGIGMESQILLRDYTEADRDEFLGQRIHMFQIGLLNDGL